MRVVRWRALFMLFCENVVQEKILGSNRRISLMGVSIDVIDMQQTIHLVEKYILTKTPLHLMGVNADKINEACQNNYMKNIINSCGVINADGASVILACKFLNKPLPERVAGIDLMMRLVERSEEKGYSIYLLGAREDIVKKTVEILKNKFSKLNIVGFRDGYFNESEWGEISEELILKKPDIVFVGITSPKKEYLIEYLQEKENSAVFMGVGGSFDVISGQISRAPLWMQRMGLEWLFRVMQEPRRLFKRYFLGNGAFIKKVILLKIRDRG